MSNTALYSSMIRAGKTTFFVDVREAKNGSKYISISETRISSDEKRSKSTIRIFADSIQNFRQAIEDAATASQS